MEKINKLSIKYRFKIIEDASHAIGGSLKKVRLAHVNTVTLQYLVFILSKLSQQEKVV